MKEINKLIEEISNNLEKDGDVEKIKTNLSEIKSTFNVMSKDNENLTTDIKGKESHISKINSENAERRRENETLTKTIKETNSSFAITKQELEKSTKNFDTLKEAHTNLQNTQKNIFIEAFTEATEDPNFDKIKSKLILPEFDKEKDTYLTDKLEVPDLEKNYNKIREYKEIGFLEINKNAKKSSFSGPPDNPNSQNLAQYAKDDPKGYEEWMKTRKL